MKKIMALILAALMLVSSMAMLASCGGGNKVEVKSFQDLDGLTVAFQSGTTAEGKLNELNETGSIKAVLKGNEDMAACFEMLANGEVQAVLCDSTVADGFVAKNPNKYKLAYVQKDVPEEFGIAIQKGDTKMKAAIDAALAELKADGFMDAVYDKWFGSGAEVTLPTAKSETITMDASLLNAGILTVGCEVGYPPFEDYAEDGKTPIGFDIDVLKAICIKLGLELKIQDTAFDVIFEGMGTNYDIVCAAVTIDDDRKQSVDFSTPYMNNFLAVVVAK